MSYQNVHRLNTALNTALMHVFALRWYSRDLYLLKLVSVVSMQLLNMRKGKEDEAEDAEGPAGSQRTLSTHTGLWALHGARLQWWRSESHSSNQPCNKHTNHVDYFHNMWNLWAHLHHFIRFLWSDSYAIIKKCFRGRLKSHHPRECSRLFSNDSRHNSTNSRVLWNSHFPQFFWIQLHFQNQIKQNNSACHFS